MVFYHLPVRDFLNTSSKREREGKEKTIQLFTNWFCVEAFFQCVARHFYTSALAFTQCLHFAENQQGVKSQVLLRSSKNMLPAQAYMQTSRYPSYRSFSKPLFSKVSHSSFQHVYSWPQLLSFVPTAGTYRLNHDLGTQNLSLPQSL